MADTRYVAVGRMGRPHGVGGGVRVDTRGGLPDGLRGYTQLFLGRGGDIEPVRIETWRTQGRFLLVKVHGCDTPEAARALTGAVLYVQRCEMPPLEEGEYYHEDLLGCRLVDETGRQLGVVADVVDTGAHDVLVVSSSETGEWMLPVVSEFVLSMDIEGRSLVVRVPEGLLG